MSYYNPKIYNSKNLHKDDLVIIRVMDDVVKTVLQCHNDKLKDEMEYDNSTLNKIKIEEGLKTLIDIWEEYKLVRMETIVSMIDGYDMEENVEEKEPDDLGDLDPEIQGN